MGAATAGRPGKDATGRARTREAKLGCLFTQTRLDAQGHPVRDDDSTTYVGAIETAEAVGRRLYAEAVRRGVARAEQVIVLGDGPPWIWGLAAEHFPRAIQIAGLYHAREHLTTLATVIDGPAGPAATKWAVAREAQLDAGQVESVLTALHRLRPRAEDAQEAVRKAIDYFQGDAGCKAIIAQRPKQSGMHWTVRGANANIALRCCQLSGRWEEFWEARSAG